MKNLVDLKIKKIKLIVTDVDGVLTDGSIYITDSGEQSRRFYVRDGVAMKQMLKNGYYIGMLSSARTQGAIRTRAEMLGVELCYIGSEEKKIILDNWRKKLNLEWEEIAFIGDDTVDKEVMKKVGFTACPADAIESIKKISDVVLETNDGRGCFREFMDKFFVGV